MKVSEYAGMVGSENFQVNLNGLSVHVRILDVKVSYGTVRYQVTPLAGSGSVWVQNVYQYKLAETN